MDPLAADLAIQAILGRGSDFVGGIDNEALDFSQLEDFINNDGSPNSNSYFGESLNTTTASSTGGKLLNVIVENKRNANGHSLPESPPDSSSEHPYSPENGGCEPPLPNSESLYTNLGGAIYKPTMLNPILSDNLILGSHIVVTDQTNEQQLLENGAILGENHMGMLLPTDTSRQLILTSQEPAQNFDRSLYKNEEDIRINYNQIEQIPRNINENLCEPNMENMQAVYTNLQSVQKKRKLSQDSPLVKSEPEHCVTSQLSPQEQVDEEYASSEACLSESQYQCIRFNSFQQQNWHMLCDQNLTELPTPHYRVDADKGFNFSNADDAFVCQKKNHFQITCHVQLLGDAQFVKTPDGFQKISSFHIHFYGVKHDCPTQTIRVEQSQSDRSKKPFHPVLVELVNSQVTKVTVGRLHFSETTSNNMRKKGKPNPEQRYFQLVVGLHAHTSSGNFPIVSHASQKIIVRASNPGQFESDVELCWQKGQTQDSVFHNGRVGINTDRPDESLVVHGNIKITGHIIQPSDIRAKKNIVECNTAEQLRNVQKIRVVKYDYEPSLAAQLSRDSESSDTGVIAQEVAQILPEAVRPAGDLLLENGTSIDNFLVVNKERIFMENIGAVKELCKVTDNLETRIDQLERINRRLNKLKRGDSLKSNSTVNSKSPYSHKCPKHLTCKKDDEFCSNKFIQVVIVVLVLIMAFCLAAITTLYMMEAARHSQYLQTALEASQKPLATKRPTKATKIPHTWHTPSPYHTSKPHKEDDLNRVLVDPSLIKMNVIGRPNDCPMDPMDSPPCPSYCCSSPPIIAPPDVSPFEKKTSNRNKTSGSLINSEKNKISKPFHSNDIDKQPRQKREAYEESDDSNDFYDKDEIQSFEIKIQGRNFNTTLTRAYIPSNTYYNFSYLVPISKYMPDEFVNLIFRSTQANVKEIEFCYNNIKQFECPPYYEDRRHKVNENSPSQLLSLQSIIFEVDMRDFQFKRLTYRASLKQTQNTCKLSSTKLGLEYIEYNFNFYRHCDE